MEQRVNVVQDSEIDRILDDLNQLLSTLDRHDLQIPAIHIAKAIESLERIAD